MPDGTKLIQAEEPELPPESSLTDLLANTRTEIAAVIAERDKVQRSVLPDDGLKGAIRRYVDERALKPRVQPLIGGGLQVDFAAGQFANPADKPADAFGVACWLLPEIVAKELGKAMVQYGGLRLTAEEREARLTELADRLLELERFEERIVAECLSPGQAVARRMRADPRAVLGCAVELKPAVAKPSPLAVAPQTASA